ncbi:MAG: TIGR03767 family metallophosphoesterase [Candidatus Nanopelagicales bacterium]
MSGLSRRRFLSSVSALALGWRLPSDLLGRTAAAAPVVDPSGTTLEKRIALGPVTTGQYRTLVEKPGEPYTVRLDVLGRTPSPARETGRRSLAYLGHFSDMHVMDAQSPARLEPLAEQDHALWGGAMRPHDALTVHVAASMVESMARARTSPVTGAAMAAAVVTGDSADMLSSLELSWVVQSLDGATISANSGAPGVYEGVQVWPEATYAYHPEDPAGDQFGAYGFPAVPGLLTAAVTAPVVSPGLPVPWYAVYGNHDTLYIGTLPVSAALRASAVGDTKAVTWQALGADFLAGMGAQASAFQRLLRSWISDNTRGPGLRTVTPDPARKLLDQADFMRIHLDSPAVPGPVGHGFTQANLDSGRTWWSADVGPVVRLIGLDTCNQVVGADGAVPQDQFDWLEAELVRCEQDKRLAVVLSHHNSETLENAAVPAVGPSQRLIHAEEFITMLASHPVCVAWVNGHTHVNTITAHRREDGGGFWEITTASCIDFPQQQQTIDIVDNRDGTISLFSTVLDHAAPTTPSRGNLSQSGIASWSRELAANDWVQNPVWLMGSELDRNAELLLPAPFDLTAISDATLEQAQVAAKARFLDYERRTP